MTRRVVVCVVVVVAALAMPGRLAARPDPAERWAARLEALAPQRPLEYFELAEEVADGATDDATLALARHLFALAGVLDPVRLGRSAALALADLAEEPRERRRLRALGDMLGERAGLTLRPDAGERARPPRSAALALGEAMSLYRRGEGNRALVALRRDGAEAVLEAYDADIPGGAARFLEDCRRYRQGERRPLLSPPELLRMLRLEAALLDIDGTSWSSDLMIGDGAPLIEADPDRLEQTFGVANRPLWRAGDWVRK